MLQVENLHVRYGEVTALSGVDIVAKEGEFVTLIGANGAGKSTLLRTISGLSRPSEGAISYRDSRIDRLPAHAIVGLGLVHVPERRSLFPAMTVMENLELGAYRLKEKSEFGGRLRSVFDDFPVLEEKQDRLAGNMSGGEQQMCAIARGLMLGPKLLLLDEPSLGLSPLLVGMLGTIMKRLHEGGLSIILVEQNAFLALRLADRAYVLERGRIALEGTGRELLNSDRVRKAYLGL
ncbi:ABC transporter ATP-binding protein [Bradyrhizobium sp. KB893862 SZCCT0404]|uniref:ABC transporter ATP-binding protein n=1 Tax=Bradyrhizobium sp. KB893862 SZCCT0404 TaxID=2807672 RepID=UPI001BA9B206|nr:ABC transporter ATP-binding protein [Bradyrhizobium sp. KB893862 SZCCT0404]MBR1172742.1 ABC transporter ATP-binding protein [Bradyrhizobium sp. KB893862 SZCCT0404]